MQPALNTGFGYSSSFQTDLAVLNWTQGFNDATTGVAAGRLAFDVYLDAMPFQTFSRGFHNRSFILNPTIATTGVGAIGVVAKGFVSDHIWLGGQIHDGNAASGDFDWDTVKEGEWLSAVEIGWTPGFEARKKQLVQFTYWHKDQRELAGVPGGSGWAVSSAWQINDKYFPFVRFGHSDGGAGVAAEDALSAGVEMTPALRRNLDNRRGLGKTVGKNSRYRSSRRVGNRNFVQVSTIEEFLDHTGPADSYQPR